MPLCKTDVFKTKHRHTRHTHVTHTHEPPITAVLPSAFVLVLTQAVVYMYPGAWSLAERNTCHFRQVL